MKNFKHYVMFLFLLAIGISSMCIALNTGIYGNKDAKQEVKAAEVAEKAKNYFMVSQDI